MSDSAGESREGFLNGAWELGVEDGGGAGQGAREGN